MKNIKLICAILVFLALGGCVKKPLVNKVTEPYATMLIMYSIGSEKGALTECNYYPGFQIYTSVDKVNKSCAESAQKYNHALFKYMAYATTSNLKQAQPVVVWLYPNQRDFDRDKTILFIEVSKLYLECKYYCQPLYDFTVYIEDSGQVV